ncbi:MAG TPA: hypothetical protein VFH80_09975 [Solirubrobacteraceae bacterium]|nr:hypothetical protein [Solirubrobacteraceae bacterium]
MSGSLTLHGLRARITTKLLALGACVWLDHYLGRSSRSPAALAAYHADQSSGRRWELD